MTGQIYNLAGIVGQSIGLTNEDFTGVQADGSYAVPLVRLSGTASTLTPSPFSAVVDYGDGSAVTTAEVKTLPGTAGDLVILGLDHPYATPGTYVTTIAVTEPGDSSPTIFRDLIIVASPPLSVTGQRNGGTFASAGAGLPFSTMTTNGTRPEFSGFTQAGAVIVLTATNLANPSLNLVVGTGVASSAVFWDINLVPFVDGRYNIAAVVTGQFGSQASAFLAGPFDDFSQVDATGPKVTSFQITNAKTGTFAVDFSDPDGLNVSPLTQASRYGLTRTSPAARKGQTFSVTNLVSSDTAIPPSDQAYVPVLVTGTLASTPTSLPPDGTYTLTIAAANITSLSGAALDGEYHGKYPSGNGQSGGNFKIRFTVRNGKVSTPVAVQ